MTQGTPWMGCASLKKSPIFKYSHLLHLHLKEFQSTVLCLKHHPTILLGVQQDNKQIQPNRFNREMSILFQGDDVYLQKNKLYVRLGIVKLHKYVEPI